MVLMIGMFSGTALSATEIHWWHAFKGRLGTLLAEQVDQFNAAQSDYKVIQNRKGNYSETLNAGIAAFRAKKHPHILMVFEVGTATMMAAKGAIKPMYDERKLRKAATPLYSFVLCPDKTHREEPPIIVF